MKKTAMNRLQFILDNEDLMVNDLEELNYIEFISKWSTYTNPNGTAVKIFEKCVLKESSIKNKSWKNYIKNSIIISKEDKSIKHISVLCNISYATASKPLYGSIHYSQETLNKLITGLNLNLLSYL